MGEVCDLVNGGKSHQRRRREYWGDAYHWITPAEIGQSSSDRLRLRTERRSPLGTAQQFCRSALSVSPYLSSSGRSALGRSILCRWRQSSGAGLLPRNSFDHKFLYYFLCASSVAGWTTVDTVHFKSYQVATSSSLPIPFAPLPEQQRIVGILDEAFEGIATAKANAEKNLQNARALFESHLQSVFTQRGKGWEEKSLEELGTMTFQQASFVRANMSKVGSSVVRRTKEVKELANGSEIRRSCSSRRLDTTSSARSFDVPQTGDILLSCHSARFGRGVSECVKVLMPEFYSAETGSF